MADGTGRGQNAPIAGLPKDYIVNQLVEFKSGARKTAEPRKPNDMLWLARSNKIFWRGLGVIGRIESLEYRDGEPEDD